MHLRRAGGCVSWVDERSREAERTPQLFIRSYLLLIRSVEKTQLYPPVKGGKTEKLMKNTKKLRFSPRSGDFLQEMEIFSKNWRFPGILGFLGCPSKAHVTPGCGDPWQSDLSSQLKT